MRGPMLPRHRRSEHTRRMVLDAALDLFSHQGYRATGVKEIAEAAGVSTGNVYHHFPDKEAIFRSLLEERAEDGLFVGEVVVDVAGRHARGLGDLLHARGPVALMREEVERGVENQAAGVLGSPVAREHRSEERRVGK